LRPVVVSKRTGNPCTFPARRPPVVRYRETISDSIPLKMNLSIY
jgi:hypothetical protein